MGDHGYLQIRFRNWYDHLWKISFISVCLPQFWIKRFLIDCPQSKPGQFKLRYYYLRPGTGEEIDWTISSSRALIQMHTLQISLWFELSPPLLDFCSGNSETYFRTGILFYWTAYFFYIYTHQKKVIRSKYNWDIDWFIFYNPAFL